MFDKPSVYTWADWDDPEPVIDYWSNDGHWKLDVTARYAFDEALPLSAVWMDVSENLVMDVT